MDLPDNGAFQLGTTGIAFNAFTDGLSHTILVGEKHVPIDQFGVGWLDSSTYNGDYLASCTRAGGLGIGLAYSLREPEWKFGAMHKGIVQFAWGDGSVRSLPAGISPNILSMYLERNDGGVIPE